MAIQTLGSTARGLGQGKTLRVGTFGAGNAIQGGSESYRVTVSGQIQQAPSSGDRITNGGQTVDGQVYAPGGADTISYTGQVVDAQLGPNLSLEGATVGGGGGTGGGGNTGGGNTGGGNTGGGNTGGGRRGGGRRGGGRRGGGRRGGRGSATQAGVLGGMNTSTIALIGAAGIGAYLIGQNS